MSDSKRYAVLNAAPVRAITSSTDATPIVVTTAAVHGLSTGDVINIFGHTTNVAANGTYRVTVLTTSTFSLQNIETDADIAGSGGGAGANGTFNPAAKVIFCGDYKMCDLSFDTDGGGDAAFTIKVCGSNGKSATSDESPDFAKAKSASNSYDYLEVADLEDGSFIDGDDGFVVAGADDHRSFEVNVSKFRWISVIPIAGSAGEITVVATLFDNA